MFAGEPPSRRIRRNVCAEQLDLDAVRRLLLQIGGANIAARIALGCRLLRRRSQTIKRVSSLLLSTAARDPGQMGAK
jgi:hypothetical protein